MGMSAPKHTPALFWMPQSEAKHSKSDMELTLTDFVFLGVGLESPPHLQSQETET